MFEQGKKGQTIYLDKTSKVRCNHSSKLSPCHGTIDHDLNRASPVDMLISRPLKKKKTKGQLHERIDIRDSQTNDDIQRDP